MSEIEEEVMNAIGLVPKLEEPENIEGLRDELISLSKSGELEKTVLYLKKANKKAIKNLHAAVQSKKLTKTTEIVADMLVSRLAGVLGWLGVVTDPDALSNELREDTLLRTDITRAVSLITPYVPLPGLISGSITTAKHILGRRETNATVCEENSPSSSSTTLVET